MQLLDALWLLLDEKSIEGGIAGQHLVGICVDQLREGSQCLEIELGRLGKSYDCIHQFLQVPLFLCLLLDGAEEVGEVSAAFMHNLDQSIDHWSSHLTVLNSEFAAHEGVVLIAVKSMEIGFKVLTRYAQRKEWIHSLCQSLQIPLNNLRLSSEAVPFVIIRSIAHKILREVVNERERPIIDRDSSQAHVVSIEHPMAETYGLPVRHQLS